MFKILLVWVILLSMKSYAKEFRFDYEWSEQAGGWLKFHVVPAVWDEARLRCHAEGAILASPTSNELKAAVISYARKSKPSQNETSGIIFNGVHATFSKGDFSTVDGVPLLRLSITWAEGEPDNMDNSEQCLAMTLDHNGTMCDTSCSRVLPYVCYKKDTHLVMTECGTTDLGYILEHRTGSCYKFHPNGLLWSQAYMTCVAEGGYLAIINNDSEDSVVTDIFTKQPESSIFSNYKGSLMIGFHDWGNRGRSFMTIHGTEPLESVYHKWSAGQPSSEWREDKGLEHQRQFAGNVFRNGQVDDILTYIPLAFLCEKDPNSL